MKRYTMTSTQLDAILDACKSVPLIALQCGMPTSPQERANTAWKALGDELGFDYMTVRPVPGQPDSVFDAEPLPRPPYTRVYQDNDGFWWWQAIDSYGDADGERVGPFVSGVDAGRSARCAIVQRAESREGGGS